MPAFTFAENIVSKSGKTVEGKLIEKTDKYIKIDFQGVPLTYYFDEIESIDGKEIEQPVKELRQESPRAVDEKALESKVADTAGEVNVYLNTGEVIRGKLAKKTDDSIVIKKQGNILTFSPNEVLKIEENNIIKPVLKSQKFPFSTAIITYKFSGVQVGSGEVDIDVAGNKINESSSTSITFSGQTIPREGRQMYDGKAYYDFDLKHAIVVKEENKADAFSKIFKERELVDYYAGEEKFLGKDCKVYKTPSGSFLFWNGIKLREEIKNSPIGSYVKEAVNIQQDVSIPEDRFKITSGVKILTTEEAMKEMQEMFKGLGEKLKNTKCNK